MFFYDCGILSPQGTLEHSMPTSLTRTTLKAGGCYNWIGQPDRLIYLRKFNGWHQFKKIGDPREVWCEVLDTDLHRLEETQEEDVIAAPAETGEAC